MPRTERPGPGTARSGARPTVEDVAARAGVSRGTVSRVINGSPKVSTEAREAVERAVAELGYVPNQAARSLVTSRTDVIALVVPESAARLRSEPYFSDVITGISDELAATDLQLLLAMVRTEDERERLTRYLTARRVDGVLLVSVRHDDPLPDLLEWLEMPTVLGGRRSEREPLSYVNADNAGGARAAVRHLVARGSTRVATITGPLDMEAASVRTISDIERGRVRRPHRRSVQQLAAALGLEASRLEGFLRAARAVPGSGTDQPGASRGETPAAGGAVADEQPSAVVLMVVPVTAVGQSGPCCRRRRRCPRPRSTRIRHHS
ncbi:LacI family DNA-binding transcriptional regulator [Kitasatospora sp. NPDC094028]